VAAAVNKLLWDAKTGVYDQSTTARGSVIQDANVTAILAGIPTPARARSMTRVLTRALAGPYGNWSTSSPVPSGYTHDASPYMGSFNLLSDFAVGDAAGALALMRREWGYMDTHDPGGTAWERIQPNGIPAPGQLSDSTAHAWSTGPVPALSEYVLGIAPVAPGYVTWAVTPQLGNLRWAQGTSPTPRGTIAVAWKRVGRGGFVLTVTPPPGTSGTVTLPRVRRRVVSVAEDGRAVRGARLVFTGVRGTHTFALVTR
jgi:hypothetical protein